jgi:hypothetical protein
VRAQPRALVGRTTSVEDGRPLQPRELLAARWRPNFR